MSEKNLPEDDPELSSSSEDEDEDEDEDDGYIDDEDPPKETE